MKRTSLTQGKHREANKHVQLFGKMFKMLHFKCQKSKVQNMRERRREKNLPLAPLNLILWDLKRNPPFRKEKRP